MHCKVKKILIYDYLTIKNTMRIIILDTYLHYLII